MRPEDWNRISPLLDELIELPVSARTARLTRLRHESPELVEHVERLLALDASHPDFMAEPVVEGAIAAHQPGQHIGPYRLVRPLGEGGMGQVWEAVRADGLYERRVALKLLRPGYADPNLRNRFGRERQILARLAHAHIARLLDAGLSADGQPYLALEYIHGEAITDYATRLKLPLFTRLQLFLQVCDAVSHAHANLVVHRDLKPSNILVTPAGDVRLLDFGIAKLLDNDRRADAEVTRGAGRAFTLHYAAPEQIRGEPVTTMTDVYALGVVLYELLTGARPYRLQHRTDAEWESAILGEEPARPSLAAQRARTQGEAPPPPDRRLSHALSGDLDNIVLKALRKLPEQRYPSVDALAQDLRRHLEGRPVVARAPALGYRFGKYLQRHALGIGAVTGVVLVLGLSLLGLRWQYGQALLAAQRAQAMQDFVVSLFEAGGVAGPGRTVDVRGLLDAGLRRAESELGDQPLARAELLGLIARLRMGLGDWRESLQLLDRQRPLLETLDEAAPASLRLTALSLRGRNLRMLGSPQACVDDLGAGRALAKTHAERLPGESAELLSVLGRCLRQLGRREEAQVLFAQALALSRRSPEGAIGVVASLADLASLQADAAQLDAAIQGYRRALDQLRAISGERHPLGVNIWQNLGELFAQRGDPALAEGGYAQALDIALALYGSQHPQTLEVQGRLGILRIALGRLDEAEKLITDTHLRLRTRFGAHHPEVGTGHLGLGLLAFERGRLESARHELEQAAAIWRETSSTARLAQALHHLGEVHLVGGDLAQARADLSEALTLRERFHGQDHPATALTLRVLGEALAASGEDALAQSHLRRAIAILREAFGPEHPQTGWAELALARLLWQNGEPAEADLLAGAVEQRFAPEDGVRRQLRWWARALRAEAQCLRAAARVTARASLDAVLADMRPEWPQGSLRREIEAIRRDCGEETPRVARR